MHTHTCDCGEVFDCHAPMVLNNDLCPTPVCIITLEEGKPICDDCVGNPTHTWPEEAQDAREKKEQR